MSVMVSLAFRTCIFRYLMRLCRVHNQGWQVIPQKSVDYLCMGLMQQMMGCSPCTCSGVVGCFYDFFQWGHGQVCLILQEHYEVSITTT